MEHVLSWDPAHLPGSDTRLAVEQGPSRVPRTPNRSFGNCFLPSFGAEILVR
jgi:hypothetical protein